MVPFGPTFPLRHQTVQFVCEMNIGQSLSLRYCSHCAFKLFTLVFIASSWRGGRLTPASNKALKHATFTNIFTRLCKNSILMKKRQISVATKPQLGQDTHFIDVVR